MDREDAKDLTLSIMVIVNIVLVVVFAWLYFRMDRLDASVRKLSERFELHVNPPMMSKKTSLVDKAKSAYEKVKSAAQKGYEAAKEEYTKEIPAIP